MIADPRGPYSRIRWYCTDGTVQPPVAYACRGRGGGRQHAEFSAKHSRLAELGYTVGTIFAAASFEELFESQPRQQRLRELALERYLIDIDDGWVLRGAKSYRGRVQIEDEIAAGRALLLRALTDWSWASDNFLLVRELIRVVPHGEESDLTRRVHRAAVELAERDSAAERLRAEIHSSPSAASAGKLRRWAKGVTDSGTAEMAIALADDLDALYGTSGRRFRLEQQLAKLSNATAAAAWLDLVRAELDGEASTRIRGLCRATRLARASVLAELDPTRRLAQLDTLDGLETEVRLTFAENFARNAQSRTDLLATAGSLLDCAFGSGLLSDNELAAIEAALDVGGQADIVLPRYQLAIGQLKRVPAWAAGNVRYTFAEALARYVALDPRAARFTDDLLRGSPIWMLGDVLRVLSRDLAQLTGSEVRIAGQSIATAIALNPGLAQGRLRIVESLDAAAAAELDPGDIVALPETTAELSPVAGILTLGEGNALSHVQLLARNFGIPNVAIDFEIIDLIRPLQNREVVLIVGTGGDVALLALDEASAVDDLFGAAARALDAPRITVPTPNLEQRSILHLAELGRTLSGQVIGPKAANLGELNRLFPGRVAPALAVPFGVYAEHLEKAGLAQRIRSAYRRHARGEMNPQELGIELAAVRSGIASLELDKHTRDALLEAMAREFGKPGSYGVFVRSDTNVEDLPEFTGAGLSETVPHVIGLEAQLAAIPRVWASVLSPRALAWRSSLLTNPEQIYASVLLMRSVPSDKSGVLVTANLLEPSVPGLTVSTAWGVGGAVAGEAAESLVIGPDATSLMISEAKTPYRRRLAVAGGIDWVPAASGPVLRPEEMRQLQGLSAEVGKKYEPVRDESGRQRPWDIEFGFVDGELTLFQIRPLVERKAARADVALRRLRPAVPRQLGTRTTVNLETPIGGT